MPLHVLTLFTTPTNFAILRWWHLFWAVTGLFLGFFLTFVYLYAMAVGLVMASRLLRKRKARNH